jgi:hypothetical protein
MICQDLAVNTWWLEGVWSQGVQFDILGESCYDRANYQHGLVLAGRLQ